MEKCGLERVSTEKQNGHRAAILNWIMVVIKLIQGLMVIYPYARASETSDRRERRLQAESKDVKFLEAEIEIFFFVPLQKFRRPISICLQDWRP